MAKVKGYPMMKLVFLISTVTLGVLTAAAAPLKRADVAADPGLVVHLDFDGLRSTSVGKAILAELNQPDVDTKLTALKGIFSFDPRTQLHGATIYTKSETPQEGVLIVYADFDSNRVLNLGMLAPGFHTITNDSHVIYSWIDEKEKAKEDSGDPHIFAAIRGQRIILGKAKSSLISALNVLDGSDPSLAGEKSLPELGNADAGTFIQAAVRKFDFGNKDPNAAIFKMSKLVRLQVGETGDNLAATLNLAAKDSDTATQMSAIAQGLLALLKLQQGNPDALKIANAVSLRQDGADVIATVSIPSQDAVDLIKTKVADAERKHSEDTNSASSQ
jgi:hypothetical protein